ncbi:transcription initiation factor IIB [Haloplanus sp. C73]|uniref:transcription initiation factor IIB n=1 Tax=Haloplanus sp. C73 TaxID=3421641 RepID=UPI003EB9A94E
MHTGDVYETGFDESSGQALDADAPCPECEGTIVADAGERHCTDCGLIVDEYHVDHGATPRAAPDAETDPRQVGAPQTKTMHDGGLTTTIGRFRDGTGRTLDGKTRRRLRRLRTQQRRARHGSKRERNLEFGLQEVSRLVGALGLSAARDEQAAVIFRQAQRADLLLGRSIEAVAAGSVYAACRCAGLPRSVDEVGAVARVATDRVQNAYRVLNENLGLPAVPQTPRDFVPKFATALDIEASTRKRALDLATLAIDTGVANGCQPSGVAAACVYQATRERGPARTQAELADVADVAPVTLRTRWQDLRAELQSGADVDTTGERR